MSSPAKRMRLSSQRQSLSNSQLRQSVTVTTPSQNALRSSTNTTNRSVTAPSTSYDTVSGQSLDQLSTKRRPSLSQSTNIQGQPLRKSASRQSLLPQPSAYEKPVPSVTQQKYQEDIFALQAKINKLDYEITSLEQERGMFALQHEKELREAQARADADYRKFQDAESDRLKLTRQLESVQQEVRNIRDREVAGSAAVERRARDLQTEFDSLREEKEDLESKLSDAERELRRVQVEEVEGARSRLERTMQETTAELEEMKGRVEIATTKLQEMERYSEDLEKKVLELNSKTGGGEELEVLKREFGEQIANVRRLENLERDQRIKIRKLEEERRNVNVVLEEKKSLEVQIRVLKESERRAGELELQKEILEDEKRTWTSLLEREGEEDQQEFDTPEAVVRSLVNERIKHALVLERLGLAESEVAGKDEAIRALNSEQKILKQEVEKLREQAQTQETQPAEPESKTIKRMERQQQLAKKEIEYLRAQLETFNAEEVTMTDNANFDTQRAEQIQRLEALVSEYKSEMETLHSRMVMLEQQPPPAAPVQVAGQKRKPEEEPESEQLGHQLRKNKNLQVALQKITQQSQMLAKELQATKSQLKALRASAQTRVLEMRDNPTAQHEAVKMETLRVMKQENTDLMAQLRGDEAALNRVRVVPVSSLNALQLDLQAKDTIIADREKRMRRQREIWTEKAAEFRDVISSILGYKVTFLPNGKVKVRSMYYNPSADDTNTTQEDVAEEDREDFIEFDGDQGTMKIGGGRDGPFGNDINETVNYWVGEKKEVPCLLAAMTLEFYEKYGGMNQTAA
ncbi:coiled-coil domain-containing protein mad1 [Lithohypha guttulata]|uniref:coiled-coil domain-containing protein mad1 n=1 Tax=Lithohypha guttulata TaxID=1690604 RepID=UPI002DE0FDB9|nr:coiled-coil domain-containing protein mad1 [Lithohypha guttulata]